MKMRVDTNEKYKTSSTEWGRRISFDGDREENLPNTMIPEGQR